MFGGCIVAQQANLVAAPGSPIAPYKEVYNGSLVV